MQERLGTEQNFRDPSVRDLLEASDQYHHPLMKEASVGDAEIGLYPRGISTMDSQTCIPDARGAASLAARSLSGPPARTKSKSLLLRLMVVAAFPTFADSRARAADEFRLVVQRDTESDVCTAGTLFVGDHKLCRTIELPWKSNRPEKSAIPPGRYGGTLRYDHSDLWRIELTGTEPRTVVQIHKGNIPNDSRGCILVGQVLANSGCEIVGGTSGPAYAALKRSFYGTDTPNATPDKTILVEVLPLPSLAGTWESTDAGHRWRLEISDAEVTWSETNAAGALLARSIAARAVGYSVHIERPNDRQVLQHVGFSAAMVDAILAAGPNPSWMDVSWDRATGRLRSKWSGLKAKKDAQGKFAGIEQPGTTPAVEFVFRRT